MISTKQGIQLTEALIRDSRARRAYFDAFWALAKVYDHGPQWGYVNRISGRNELKFLRSVTDPRRTDIRVAQNKIHPIVTRMVASSAPENIDFDLVGRSAAEHGYAVSAQRLLQEHLFDIGALELFREKEPYKYTLGSVIIRRTLAMRGQEVDLAKPTVRDFRPGLAIVEPHEILRDPAACTMRPERDEQIYCHEKPQTVDWVKRNFGVTIKAKTTMGDLMGYQKAIQSATGLASNAGISDSKTPAVLVYECYFQDPAEPGDWPWVLFAYMDSDPDSGQKLVPLGGVRQNPFYGLPFHQFNFDTTIHAPWGRGVPHIEMGGQDIFNISLTWLVRAMQEGGGRWLIPEGAISDKTQAGKILTNRIDKPFFYNASMGGQKPERSRPPELNPGAMSILQQAPQWMKESVNLSDVQFGQPAGKRGESAQALDVRLGEANATLEKSRRDDELTMENLLYGVMVDLINPRHTHLSRARKLLGKATDDKQTRALFRESPADQITRVVLHPTMVRPATRAEKKNEFVSLATAGVMDPNEAQWEMMLRKIYVNTGMRNSFDKQLVEIDMMRSGKDVPVSLPEDHDLHIKAIKWYFSRPASTELAEKDYETLMQHFAAHTEAKLTLAQGENMLPPQAGPSQGSAPAQAAMAASQATGPAQPAMM